jgi:ligand-binding sensor domain-containing protein
MFSRTLILLFCCVLVWNADAARESTMDSIVYDKGTSWSTITPSEPVIAFALCGASVWYATDKGIAVYNTRKNDLKDWQTIPGAPAEGVTSIAADMSGTIWVGTGEGLYSGDEKGFKKVATGVPGTVVNKVVAANDGSVWAGTDGGAARCRGGVWTSYNTKNGLCGDNVLAIVHDGQSTVWMGTGNGLCSFNGAKWTTYTSKNGLSADKVSVLGYDERREELWAVVGDKHVDSFDGEKWSEYLDAVEDINDIMADSQSRIWFGSPSNGLVKFNGDDWIADPQQLGVAAREVRQMYKDEGGNLFFASEKGLIRMMNPYPF